MGDLRNRRSGDRYWVGVLPSPRYCVFFVYIRRHFDANFTRFRLLSGPIPTAHDRMNERDLSTIFLQLTQDIVVAMGSNPPYRGFRPLGLWITLWVSCARLGHNSWLIHQAAQFPSELATNHKM